MRKLILIFIFSTFICKFSYGQVQSPPKVTINAANRPALSREQIIDTLSKIISNPKTNKKELGSLYYLRAENYRLTGKFDQAYQDYTSSIKLGGESPYVKNSIWNRGLTNEALNSFSSAIADYRTVLTRFPATDSSDKAILYCNIAYNEMRLQKADSALLNDSISISYNPVYARGFFVRGLIHMAIKKYEPAIVDFTKAIASNHNFSNIKQLSIWYMSLADAKRYNKQYKEAINNYSFALKLDPDNRVAYWNRAAAYYKHKDYELATDDYTKAITYYPGQNKELSRLYDDRALNEMGQNLLTKAIQDDSLSIALDPSNKSAYFNLAEIYSQNAEYQKGIDLFKTSLTFQKENKKLNSFLYYQIANNEYFLNEFDKVIEDCTSAITLNPDDAAAYYYRAKVYLKKLDKKDLAMTDFNKVIELDTSHKTVSYIFSLFYIGKSDEATRILQSEVVNTTDDPVLLADYYNLACLYSLMNKPDDANNYLKMAIDKGYAKKYAAADEDLDNIRNTADYKAIMSNSK